MLLWAPRSLLIWKWWQLLSISFFNLFHRHIAGQLMHDGGDHLQVAEFFRSGELSAYQMAGIGGEFDLSGVLKISKQALMDASRTSRCT